MFRKAEGCDSGTCVEVDTDNVTFTRATGCGDGTCVEVGFVKAVESGAGGCVEVNRDGACSCTPDGDVLIRDSKDRDGPILRFTAAEWRAFEAGVIAGEFHV